MKNDNLQFSADTIGRWITEIFKSAGRVTVTSIYKMCSSSAIDLPTVQKRLVNHQMKHCEATSNKNYMLQVNAAWSASVYSLLKDIRLGQDMAKEEAMFLSQTYQSSHQTTHSSHTPSIGEAGEWSDEEEVAPIRGPWRSVL